MIIFIVQHYTVHVYKNEPKTKKISIQSRMTLCALHHVNITQLVFLTALSACMVATHTSCTDSDGTSHGLGGVRTSICTLK